MLSPRRHRERIEKLKLANAGMAANDWLCVVGVGSAARVKIVVKTTKANRFTT